ncbi:MAG: hypothetical protein M1827_005741 [Pycnora praestabilis]|nr:MAG: hypothetical protein M1827_005741 [Pycnora praestabilis]
MAEIQAQRVRHRTLAHWQQALFDNLVNGDIGAAWIHNPRVWQEASALVPGCHGLVLNAVSGPGRKVIVSQVVYPERIDPAYYPSIITGASYVRLSDKDGDTSFVAAEGLRAFLGGGGQIFSSGRSSSSFDTSASSNTDVQPRPPTLNGGRSPGFEAAVDALETSAFQWVYPDAVQLGDSRYTQQGNSHSLLYLSELGELVGKRSFPANAKT